MGRVGIEVHGLVWRRSITGAGVTRGRFSGLLNTDSLVSEMGLLIVGRRSESQVFRFLLDRGTGRDEKVRNDGRAGK